MRKREREREGIRSDSRRNPRTDPKHWQKVTSITLEIKSSLLLNAVIVFGNVPERI